MIEYVQTRVWVNNITMFIVINIYCEGGDRGPFSLRGWLGWAMVMGSFQCRSVLLLWHTVGQGPAVLAAMRDGWAVLVCLFVVFFHLVYPFFVSSRISYLFQCLICQVGRLMDILKYCRLGHYNPAVVVSYYRRRAR